MERKLSFNHFLKSAIIFGNTNGEKQLKYVLKLWRGDPWAIVQVGTSRVNL